MSHRLSQAARHTQELLQDLERDKELDVIRIYLARFELFPRARDPKTAPIRSEELRDLVKFWKLHRQRNFWKNHTTKEDLVRMLYKHITTKVMPNEKTLLMDTPHPTIPLSPARPPSGANVDSPSKFRRTSRMNPPLNSPTPRGSTTDAFDPYGGDLFHQRGDYDDGMLYVSRLAPREAGLAIEDFALDLTDPASKDPSVNMHGNMHDEDASRREKRLLAECACSLYQLTLEPGHEADIVREGCIPAIVRMCTFDDVEVKKYCSATIVNVSLDASLTARLIDEGVLGGLMELAKVQQEDIRRNAAIGICRISYDRLGQAKLIQEGSVPALISMLNNTDFETKEACVKTLINIASFSGAVVSESVTHTVTRIAAKRNRAYDRFIVETICDLSLLSGPRAKASDDGILEPIYDINRATTDLDLKRMIAIALSNFSGLEVNHQHMANPRILHALDSLLSVDDVSIREMAATAIANLACSAEFIDRLVAFPDAEASDPFNMALRLVQAGYNASQVVQENVSAALLNIALRGENHRVQLTQHGVALLLIHFFETSNWTTKLHAVVLLCTLMANDLARAQLVQHDVHVSVVKLAADATTRDLCAVALFNLSCFADMAPYLLAPQTLATVVELLTPPSKDEKDPTLTVAQAFALDCLYNLSFLTTSSEILIHANCIAALGAVFRKPSKNMDANLRAAATICNMAFCPTLDLLQRMLDEEVLKLVRRLGSNSANHRELTLCCSTALCNLAVPALQTSGSTLVNMLIELSHTPHAEIAFVCAISFSKLASAASGMREMLAKVADLPPTLTVMMRSGIEDVQIHCAAALCGLACERGVKGSRHMWKEGTITDFIVNSLLRINSDSTKEVCARVLFNLLTHEDCRSFMIKDGVLYALVKLARLDSVEIRTLCVTALYNLSTDAAMVSVLMDINVAHVIAKMCDSEFNHVDNRRRLAACLTNVALHGGLEAKLMEGGGLNAVLVLCDQGDVDCMRYGASVLSSLSGVASNCDGLATPAALELVLKMTAAKDKYQCLFALHAICNVSCVAALHDKIEEAETIAAIVRVLGESDDHEILETCSKVLCNLAFHPKHHATIIKHHYVQILVDMLQKHAAYAPVAAINARIVSMLTEDAAVVPQLVATGVVQALHLACSHAGTDDATISHCITSLCRLAHDAPAAPQIVRDGVFDILNAAVPLSYDASTGPKIASDIAERCSMILRTLSTVTSAIPAMVADQRHMPLAIALAFHGEKETCRNVVLLLHNITAARNRDFQRQVRRSGVLPLLIKLAKLLTTEEKQICAVALAHINSDLSEADRHEIEEYHKGLVHTMVSMLDMDPPTMQRAEKIATAMPPLLNIPRLQTDFLPGAKATRLLTQIPVSWQLQDAPIDPVTLVPKSPIHFMNVLPQRHTEFRIQIKDALFGSFQILQVSQEKSRLNLPPPKTMMTMDSILNMVDTVAENIPEPSVEATLEIDELDALLTPRPKSIGRGNSSSGRHILGTTSTPGGRSNDAEDDKEEVRKPSKVSHHKSPGRSLKSHTLRATGQSSRNVSSFALNGKHAAKSTDEAASHLPKI
ncbi:hypothetical protein LEN26_013791 [Aphanomyces euteiches]|nr:hypothetical protein LEN26_013791 [Aphanomyces euteiches]